MLVNAKSILYSNPITSSLINLHLKCRISDYGNPDDKEDCLNLLKISPLHNVNPPESQNVQYPAMLFITGDNDEVYVNYKAALSPPSFILCKKLTINENFLNFS